MNDNELDRIAAMANALRPDWPVASLRSLLARPALAARGRRDVAVALAWVACEAETKTPARVLEAGPWWIATNADGNNRRTSYDQPCPEHPDSPMPCRQCASKRTPNPIASQRLAQARAQLTAATAGRCSHGVAPERCAEHKPNQTDTDQAARPESETSDE